VSNPQVAIYPNIHWCQRHLEPFRAEWPKGYITAAVMLVTRVLQRDDIARAAGYNPDTGQSAEVTQLKGVLVEYAPLCCLVGEEVMQKIYAATWRVLA
jgi:hypothetical protein